MNFIKKYNIFKEKITYSDDRIDTGLGVTVRNFDFQSWPHFSQDLSDGKSAAILEHALSGPGAGDGGASGLSGVAAGGSIAPAEAPDELQNLLDMRDDIVAENLSFRYHLMLPAGVERAEDIILLFHGLNEKYWHKYFPWSARLVEQTGKAVLMFPIAFHMNRAPALWSDPHTMFGLSRARKQQYPSVVGSTLSNVALSTRLHNRPDRFIWSGLESYHDVIDLVQGIKNGLHPAIAPNAGIDFFSYSIGTFLGEIIMMTNHNGWFSQSKYTSFCGGPVFNRLSPVSKFIMDSEACVALYSYFVEHLESHMRENKQLGDKLGGDYPEGVNFRSLLDYRSQLRYREDKFRGISDRFYAIALANDEVVPPYEVKNTLQGSAGDINIRVDALDYPYPYRHEDPFPINEKIADSVEKAFDMTFNKICAFLNGNTPD